jgi:hypothetical protein
MRARLLAQRLPHLQAPRPVVAPSNGTSTLADLTEPCQNSGCCVPKFVRVGMRPPSAPMYATSPASPPLGGRGVRTERGCGWARGAGDRPRRRGRCGNGDGAVVVGAGPDGDVVDVPGARVAGGADLSLRRRLRRGDVFSPRRGRLPSKISPRIAGAGDSRRRRRSSSRPPSSAGGRSTGRSWSRSPAPWAPSRRASWSSDPRRSRREDRRGRPREHATSTPKGPAERIAVRCNTIPLIKGSTDQAVGAPAKPAPRGWLGVTGRARCAAGRGRARSG